MAHVSHLYPMGHYGYELLKILDEIRKTARSQILSNGLTNHHEILHGGAK